MSDIRWTGLAAAVAQVDTFTPANVEIGDIFTLTITGGNGRIVAISFTATATTIANVTAGLAAAWTASNDALCTAITATDNETDLTLTAVTAGNAFSVVATATNGGSNDDQTLSRAATTASSGPKHFDAAGNWSGGAVPGGASGQDVYIDNWAADILYGLDQSAMSNALDSLNLSASFTGKIAENGAAGAAGDYLQIKATVVNIGRHNGYGTPAGSGRIKIDLGSTASTVTVDKAATPADSATGKPAVRLLANNAATVIRVRKGSVGVAIEAGETTTISKIDVDYVSSVTGDANVFIGNGVTITTVNQNGGDVIAQCAITIVNANAGTLLTNGAGAITTLNVAGATVIANSTGTVTNVNITAGVVDTLKSAAPRTFTNVKLNSGTFKRDPDVLTLTNGVTSDKKAQLTASAA